MNMKSPAGVLVLLSLMLASPAAAHRPDFGEGAFADPVTAYVVEDPAVSIVVYRDVTCERPELWMRVDAPAGFPLFVQLLTPAIDRLAGFRPSLAVVGPGLPRNRTSLDVPSGLGSLAFRTDSVAPVVFDEPFTATRDWILVEDTVTLPEAGTYYVVAWDPRGSTGKLAVAIGIAEEFGLLDMFRFPGWRRQAQEFHETGRFAPTTAPVERICP